jgi:hypothetical protein
MSETSARLGLPLMVPGQAQKEWIHNEALTLLDLAVQPGVVAVGVDDPPAAPGIGQAWVVGTAPTGGWTGHADAVAGWTAGGWRFVAAREGMAVWSLAAGCDARFTTGAWRVGLVAATRLTIGGVAVVGAQRPGIADPAGGPVVDDAARSAIVAILDILRGHGLIAS